MKNLRIPLTEQAVRSLELGESVTVTGTIYTARDAAHKYLAGTPDWSSLPDLHGAVLYHCGPVIVPDGDGWRVTAAGPTTSVREEPYEAGLICALGLRAIIGKGGMGAKTAAACRECGCVYLHAVGGAAQVLASSVRRVAAVYKKEEFGAPEAIWQLEVVEFPAVVTMDACGNSLHEQVRQHSASRLSELISEV